jgi:uncharacterized protein YbjT (DUF2867 family)
MEYNVSESNEPKASTNSTIVLAGATGELGRRIAGYLIQFGAKVIALVRTSGRNDSINELGQKGVRVMEVDFNNHEQLVKVCEGSTCLVSALNGLDDVIVDVQTKLLNAAIEAGVTRLIPSDYCIDYTNLADGSNRNLDLRRRFANIIDNTSINATSILNGMFTDLLTGQAPVILSGIKRVLYWESADQLLDFTTIDNTAEYTARAALEEVTPRFLRIAGEVTNAKGLVKTASRVHGKEFHLLKAGGLSRLKTMIKITKTLFPQKTEVFPPWQGMQYLHDMFTGKPKLAPLDNSRYSGMHWTTVEEVLTKAKRENK